MSEPLFTTHQTTLNQALAAISNRQFYSAYPEVPSGKIYGETAKVDGQKAFENRLNTPFSLSQPGIHGTDGHECSPYGFDLGIDYLHADLEQLIPAMQDVLPSWRDAGIEVRTGIALEILKRLNQKSFEIGFSVMHTSGQGFVMAFQAGGPHAQDRGLEAVAYAYRAMTETNATSTWVKPQGRHDPLSIEKKFTIVPKGISLAVGCATFPTWNSYPGIFASLVTGNPVIVKPHPNAILPLAITVEVAQQVLVENGFAPHIIALAPDTVEQPITKDLAMRKEVKLIDFTGGSEFGNWLEDNARQARIYTEKAGVNSIVIDSCRSLKAVINNLTFSLCLYSGQMCTTPQNIYIPAAGIDTEDGHMSFDDVASALGKGIDKFLSDPARAAEVLGCVQSKDTLSRIERAASFGDVVLESKSYENPHFAEATVRSPILIKIDASEKQTYMQEQFGPIVFLIAAEDTCQSISLAKESAQQKGAITWGVYSIVDEVLNAMESAALDAGVALSCNLTGGLFVNQSAAFSDFHATGANPAANACLTDSAFISGRFSIVQSRRHTA